jgi:hypothetical protein
MVMLRMSERRFEDAEAAERFRQLMAQTEAAGDAAEEDSSVGAKTH